jgi:hypothetical protein
MSTSITINDWQIVIYNQKELYSKLEYWIVEVWQDFDQLAPKPGDEKGKAKCLLSISNLDSNDSGYSLTSETLQTLTAKATAFILEENK